MSDELKDRFINWFEVAMRIAVPILLGALAWQIRSTMDHEHRLTTIEASRYTAQDAARDRNVMTTEIGGLKVETARAAQAAESVSQRLGRMEDKLDQLLQGRQ